MTYNEALTSQGSWRKRVIAVNHTVNNTVKKHISRDDMNRFKTLDRLYIRKYQIEKALKEFKCKVWLTESDKETLKSYHEEYDQVIKMLGRMI
jgi:hypothetical protein